MKKYQVIDEQTNVESISFELEFAKFMRNPVYKHTAECLDRILEKERGRINTAQGGKMFINTIDRKKIAPEIVDMLIGKRELKNAEHYDIIKKRAEKWLQSIEQETDTPTPNQYADFVLVKARDQFEPMTREQWGDDTDYEVYFRNTAPEFSERMEAVEEWAKMKREQPTISHDEQPVPAQSDTSKKKGRPTKPFKDLMLNDKDGEHLKKIHALMKGKNGKDAGLIMLACIKMGWITRPTYTQVTKEFGDIGSKQGFLRYMNESCFTKDELDGAMNSLN